MRPRARDASAQRHHLLEADALSRVQAQSIVERGSIGAGKASGPEDAAPGGL